MLPSLKSRSQLRCRCSPAAWPDWVCSVGAGSWPPQADRASAHRGAIRFSQCSELARLWRNWSTRVWDCPSGRIFYLRSQSFQCLHGRVVWLRRQAFENWLRQTFELWRHLSGWTVWLRRFGIWRDLRGRLVWFRSRILSYRTQDVSNHKNYGNRQCPHSIAPKDGDGKPTAMTRRHCKILVTGRSLKQGII